MRVGLHEAIHEVGQVPSAMNSGAQTALPLFGAISKL